MSAIRTSNKTEAGQMELWAEEAPEKKPGPCVAMSAGVCPLFNRPASAMNCEKCTPTYRALVAVCRKESKWMKYYRKNHEWPQW